MRLVVKWVGIPVLTVAMGLFLAERSTPFGSLGAGIAYARGGGRSAGATSGGMREDAMRGAEMGQGHQGRAVGNAVSEAATSTAHAGKDAAQDAGFKNLGGAVSSAVHNAQPESDTSGGVRRK